MKANKLSKITNNAFHSYVYTIRLHNLPPLNYHFWQLEDQCSVSEVLRHDAARETD
jgi:hypothetical protein